MSVPDGRTVVTRFWEAMGSGDFIRAAGSLTPDAEIHWPQSGELIRGPANFAALNAAYPVAGRWRVTQHRVLCDGTEAVADATVADDRVLSFASLRGDRIARLVEWWPEPFPAQAWRSRWVETGTGA